MLLLIDAGNTQIKWAVLDSAEQSILGGWVQMGSLNHQEVWDKDTALPWSSFQLKRIIVSNVAGDMVRNQLLHLFQDKKDAVVWFVPEAKKAGIKNHYRNPSQLGSDRFAAAIAARALFAGQAVVIAICGTALTIDAVTVQGDFIGGMIVPGLKLMAQSLADNTAQLPMITENNTVPVHFANHTEAAMASGCLAAQVGSIEYAVREFATSQQIADPLCIISGGAAKYIMSNLKIPHQFVDNLVLIGLQLICSPVAEAVAGKRRIGSSC